MAGLTAVGTGSPAGAYTVEQAIAGQGVYEQNCQVCHGASLQGSFFFPSLAGRSSRIARDFATAAEMHASTSTRMPQDRPGALPSDDYWNVISFILSQNATEPDGVPLGPATAATVPITVGSPPINLAERGPVEAPASELPTATTNGEPPSEEVIPPAESEASENGLDQ